jgi:uncharacterized protein (TIGR04255 family)
MTDVETTADAPLGGLSLYDSPIFENHYIDLVALEVRWGSAVGAISTDDALKFRTAIEESVPDLRLPFVDRVEQRDISVVLGDANEQAAPTVESGFQLRDEDRDVTVVLLPRSVAIQVSAYSRWSVSILPLLVAALSSAVSQFSPDLVARMGLRYINRIEDESCKKPADWSGKIAPALLSVYNIWGLQTWVRQAQQQIELTIDREHIAVLRHALLYGPGGPDNYMIDVDVFSQRARSVDPAGIAQAFTRMNRTALAIFQQSVDHDYLAKRQEGGEEDE